MNRSILLLLALLVSFCCAYHNSNRYGILYINEILANSDTHTVIVEESIVQDNTITTNRIEEWTGNGVYPEEIFIKDDNVELFGDFVVHPAVTFPSQCDFNGGVVADSPLEDFFSFAIEDNTGDTSLRGILYPGSGLNINDGAFVIVDGSAETRIRDALLHANGGINLNDFDFAVDGETGDIHNNEYAHFVGNIYVGSSLTERRIIGRHPTNQKIGKDAYLIAQDGAIEAGDLYLLPGTGEDRNGNIIFGRDGFGEDILVTRDREFSTDTGGDTIIQAQDSLLGFGGHLFLQAGDSTGNGSGGNIVLAPGVSRTSGLQGQILFGTNVQEDAAFDTYISRPFLKSGNGGDTFLRGQSTENGDAGYLMVRAGQIPENANSFGGDLHISPGIDNLENHAKIYLGSNKAHDLVVTRYTIPSIGGQTLLRGQPSLDGNGGDLYLQAGNSGGNGNGGNIHFVPGTTPVTSNGDIYLGLQLDSIDIVRPASGGTGFSTSIFGQDSAQSGGDLNIFAGDGSDGGDLILEAGDAELEIAGSIRIAAGYGEEAGGNVQIFARGENGLGGDVLISAGAGIGAFRGGDIFINGGTGFSQGGIISIGGIASQVITTGTQTIIDDGLLAIQTAATATVFRPNSMSLIAYQGLTLLRAKSDIEVPDVPTTPATVANMFERVRSLQNSLNALVNALGQCSHGLFLVVDGTGQPLGCA